MSYLPEQGDIIWLDFDPSLGKEIMKRRPAFVLSKGSFNRITQMAIVAPITSTIRNVKLEVVLPVTSLIQGAVLVYQLKSVDFHYRKAMFIEHAATHITAQVAAIARLLVQ